VAGFDGASDLGCADAGATDFDLTPLVGRIQLRALSMMAKEGVGAMDRWRAYSRAKTNAKSRDIPFNLTFSEWWEVWQRSGLYEYRGRGGYVMTRIDFTQDYNPDNVQIRSAGEVLDNVKEAYGT
jgi:hypothetical protein